MNATITRNAVLVGAIVVLVSGVAIYRQRTQPALIEHANEMATTQPAGLPRMVDLGADKCIPCKEMAPILVELKKEYAGKATIDFIDVWKNPQAGEPYGVRIIPTQIFFDRDGKEVWRHEGFLPKADIVAKLKELGVG